MYRIHDQDAEVLDAANVLEVAREAVTDCNKWLNLKECNILVYADKFATIPEQGVGGRCGEADTILIFIDPKHKNGIIHNVKQWMPSAIAHEMCHARRYATWPVAKTLGEALVDEGLPSMFEEFMYSDIDVPYAHNLDSQELSLIWKKAKPILKSEDFNRDDWFYGGNGIKKWTGYSLGYDMVRQYMAKRNIKNPAAIVEVKAEEIF